ncbi:MAG: hypothetical protein OXP75_07770 [Rhodospirillales bacterium]|nr:hypothetical protein [Rhodospirillales bacterium]
MNGRALLAAVVALLMVPYTTAALAGDDELIVRIQAFPTTASLGFQLDDRLDQSGLNLHALEHSEFSKGGLDVELQWEPTKSDDDFWLRSVKESLESKLQSPSVLFVEQGQPYPEFETDVVPVRIATLEERFEIPAVSSLSFKLQAISGHDERTCRETPRRWDIVVYASENDVNDDPRIPKFLSALKTLVRQANTLKAYPFFANVFGQKQDFGAYYELPYNETIKGVNWFADATVQLMQLGWPALQNHALIQGPYGSHGYALGVPIGKGLMTGWGADWFAERQPPCIRSWSFMTEGSYKWSLSASDTVVVQIGWNAHFAVEGFLYSAIVNGDFAARGLVVDIVSGAYGLHHFSMSGRYEPLLYDVEWISMAATGWVDNEAFFEEMRATMEEYDEAIAEVVRSDIVIGGDGFSAAVYEEQDIVVRSYRRVTELVLEPRRCAYLCSPRYEQTIYASPKAEEDTRAERFLDAISDRVRTGWGLWLADQGFGLHGAKWTMHRDGRRISEPDYPSVLGY